MLQIFILCAILTIVVSICPMSYNYKKAEQISIEQQQKQAKLIEDGFIIEGDNDPAPPVPLDIERLYNKTMTLLIAEQLFSDDNKQLLNSAKIELLSYQESCIPENDRCNLLPSITCDVTDLYRSIDGSCNNLKNPKWGMQYSSYSRFGPVDYFDGIYDVRKSFEDDRNLPDVRKIGNRILQESPYKILPKSVGNYGGLIFGQFIAHDIGWRRPYQNPEGGAAFQCCNKNNRLNSPDEMYYGCMPFSIPKDDSHLSRYNITCMDYVRSQPVFPNDCTLDAAQQVNGVTHYLDLSTIYGSNREKLQKLRTFEGGKLVISKNVLPVYPQDCDSCYVTGDRNVEVLIPVLTMFHSIFIRLHNNIAENLATMNSYWDDNRLFEESRRLTIALYQHLIYNEWTKNFLNQKYINDEYKSCTDNTFCGSYNAKLDASAINEFSHAAFSQFHWNIPTEFDLLDEDYVVTKSFNISEFDVGASILEDQFNDVLRGSLLVPVQFGKYVDELRNNLFKQKNPFGIGIDLLSIDIFKGRDHGHCPYYVYKNICTLNKPVTDWKDFEGIITHENIQRLKSMYASVFDIDLFVGLSLEGRLGDYLGPVGNCIVAEQFKRLKYGDRFFYSFLDGPNPFTEDQMIEIKKYSFAKLYCNNVDIREMLQKPLEVPSKLKNIFLDCREFGQLNLSAWKDDSNY